MKTNRGLAKSRLIQMGCVTMCLFYLLGLFNGLVLETLHEVSHIIGPKTHHHSFTNDHEDIDYSSLEAMAGHSHETLEALKELLKVNEHDEQESKDDISLKLDKHLSDETTVDTKIITLSISNDNWAYQSMTSFWCLSVISPPPQFS